jgi:hypothetical protein
MFIGGTITLRPRSRRFHGRKGALGTVFKSGARAHHFDSLGGKGREITVPVAVPSANAFVTVDGRYHSAMYADGLSFLDEERDAFRPFEALLELSDEELERPVEGTHGWNGRDLMAHIGVWIEWWLNIAQELAVNPKSPAFDALEAIGNEWESKGDELNARYQAQWAALPIAEVRRRFSTMPGELRGYLTVVPETRWLKDSKHLKSLLGNTTEHYPDHETELRAILAASGR